MIYIILLVSWALYSLIEGYREAYYWHYKINSTDFSDTQKEDLHPIFTVQRGVVLLVLFFSLTLILNIVGATLILIANSLIFSFIHNGMMYSTRNKLTIKMYPNDKTKWIYPNTWLAMSSTSTAKLTKIMTPLTRIILFLLGVSCYAYVFIRYINI